MKIRTLLIGLIPAAMVPMMAYSQTTGSENTDAPEIDACRATGLVWMAPADQGLFCCDAMIVGAVMSSACRCGS